MTKPGNFVLYDGECPVCSRYVALTRLRESRPDFKLLDARKEPTLVEFYRRKGIEINDMMVVQLAGETPLVGGAAMVYLNAAADRSARLSRFMLRVPPSVIVKIYPGLVIARKVLLKLLGRELIA